MSRPSRAGNEFAGFLPQASASGTLPPFPSLRSRPAVRVLATIVLPTADPVVAANPLPSSVTNSAAGVDAHRRHERGATRPAFQFARPMHVGFIFPSLLLSRRCCAPEARGDFSRHIFHRCFRSSVICRTKNCEDFNILEDLLHNVVLSCDIY